MFIPPLVVNVDIVFPVHKLENIVQCSERLMWFQIHTFFQMQSERPDVRRWFDHSHDDGRHFLSISENGWRYFRRRWQQKIGIGEEKSD